MENRQIVIDLQYLKNFYENFQKRKNVVDPFLFFQLLFQIKKVHPSWDKEKILKKFEIAASMDPLENQFVCLTKKTIECYQCGETRSLYERCIGIE